MFAATLYELAQNRHVLNADSLPMFLVGFVAAFITALVVVRVFLAYVSRHNFTPFAYYRIIFGVLVLVHFS